MEEIQIYLSTAEEMMEKSINHIKDEFSKIRAGKASPGMVEGVEVKYYGNTTPLNQVAGVTTPDARTISIKPWEKNMLREIERAIINSDLGFNPQNDGEQIRISIPPLTEERRLQLMKQVKAEAENGKVRIRNIRKDTNDSLKKLEGISEDLIKDAENDVQKLTDVYTSKIDALVSTKEKDIMTV
ncbi:MAG: ribosome recycling factor [Ekhidna sp.]|nr:ribosome recycling factor [Ekhidna sp.]MBC6408954.1 ribosome recycling factor [Ekhidna sp.]MBC6427357.1 ribosome recycling factor [Ekhidna sp.]